MNESRVLAPLFVTRRFHAPRERVFQAFTDPAQIPRWFGEEGGSTWVVQLDLREGGSFLFRGTHRGDECEVKGTYREVRVPERLVFTWVEMMAGRASSVESLVTVEFRDLGQTTEVVLTHERDVDQKERRSHEQGWKVCFDRMEKLIAETGRNA
ncbi:MAG: SRPBCC domain-containing protein [Acidobacteriota bacterium]|nr:SRPBCC domain-containing protein [Acidobacteriota bacterium]